MKVHEIIKCKGSEVHTIDPQSPVSEVVQLLVKYNCGSLVVTSGDKMVGIITERDILKTCAFEDRTLDDVRVEDRMTQDVITGSPDEEVSEVMGLMTRHRIRHLPILDMGQLCGLISIGDVVKAQHDHLSLENHYLKSYLL
ncbi:MAG: CBS domain-containing protein, partial [Planctomycetales bacterium]|nr:CBS domain-containing protein [Planctomycetales bacterium]